MTRIVLSAGHWLYEGGRRCLKKFDVNETREWELNKRIVEKVQAKLKDYENVEVLRVDDPTGKTFIDVDVRARKANNFKADIYCSFHHNAGINGGAGGGITVLTYDNREELSNIRTKLYNALLNAGGIKGNRSQPLQNRPDLAELRMTNMSAVLVEHGFMDSSVDVPIIVTDAYAEKMANGWIDFFEKYLGIKKNPIAIKPVVKPSDKITVLEFQKAAIADGFKFPKYGADGKWGNECVAVAKKNSVKLRCVGKSYSYKYKNLTKLVQKAVGSTVDGLYGEDTYADVVRFQKSKGLYADGVVGLNTWRAILGV